MTKITYEDRARLLEALDRDLEFDERGREVIRVARFEGLVFKRRNTKRLQGLAKPQRKTALGQNRFALSVQRRLLRRARFLVKGSNHLSVERETTNKSLLTSRYNRSILLEGMVQNRQNSWQQFGQRLRSRKTMHIDVNDFSFVDAPRRTMDALVKIAEAECSCLEVTLDFTQEKCLDVGPWLLLAIMRKDMAPVIKGAYMHDSLSKVISELKLDRSIGISLKRNWPTPVDDVWAFPVEERRASGKTNDKTPHLRPQTIEKVGGNMVSAIDRWLGQCNESQNLTIHGKRLIMKIVGETLDNAERHSRPDLGQDPDGEWMVSGFMARRIAENGKQYLRCHLAFLSVGTSIADSIQNCPKPIADKMNKYVQAHKHQLRGMHHAESHLRTVYALQDGVTRDERAYKEDRSGSGFGSILAFFKDLAGGDGDNLDATLSIVSGNTCLRIPYEIAPEFLGVPGETRNIWLNRTNDVSKAPDHNTVVELEHRLNGTLITMAFNLDADYLKETEHASN